MLSFMMLVVPAGRVAGVDALLWRPRVRKDLIVPELVEEPPVTAQSDSGR
jgi:hypothetical protein